MADDFERRLERLFAQGPGLDDEAFAARVERKLGRGWFARRLTIGAFGLAGGVVAATQLMVSGVADRLETVSAGSRAALPGVWRALASELLGAADLGGGSIWMAAALAAVAGGYALRRMLQEI